MPNKKTLSEFGAVPNTYWFYNRKKSAKINSDANNNFSSDVGKQLLIANDRNRICGTVLGHSQDVAYTNIRENSLMRDLSNDSTANRPLFSLVNTFKQDNETDV